MQVQAIDQLRSEMQHVRQEAAAKEKQIQDAIAAAERAVAESEYTKQKQAEQARIEQARQAKLQSWRENALQPARQRLQATQQHYAEWLDNVRDVQNQLVDLQTRLAQMGSEVRGVAADLLKTTVNSDWIGTFASDEEMESFVNAEVAKLPKVSLTWVPFPALTDTLSPGHVEYTVRVDLHGHVTSRSRQTPVESFVKSRDQLRSEDMKRMRGR